MQFEYDKRKSELNLEKHGIDFEEGQLLWQDQNRIQFALPTSTEQRFGLLARYAGSIWLAVITYREEKIRIISVRRATTKEVSAYDKAYNS